MLKRESGLEAKIESQYRPQYKIRKCSFQEKICGQHKSTGITYMGCQYMCMFTLFLVGFYEVFTTCQHASCEYFYIDKNELLGFLPRGRIGNKQLMIFDIPFLEFAHAGVSLTSGFSLLWSCSGSS